jgi:phosphatidylserine decarboxylase
LAKDGIPVVLALILFAAIATLGAFVTHEIILKYLVVISLTLVIFSIYFFRDPKRTVPTDDNVIVSPADGKVILIEKINDKDFFGTTVLRISIFMSVFNVHVNRIPIDGRITYFNYQKGKFHQAFRDQAAYENEQTTLVIENNRIKVQLKQIAGIVARRIVCHIREGWKVKQGERFGMIKFGSRVDMLLPLEVELNIKLNQKVKGGETILGRF